MHQTRVSHHDALTISWNISDIADHKPFCGEVWNACLPAF